MITKKRGKISGYLGVTMLLVIIFLWTSHEEVRAAGKNRYEKWLQTVYSRENGLSVGEANDIATTSDGIIWIGTYAGLYRHNGAQFELMSKYDTVKNVNCLYVDSEDRLWVGTNDNGISVFQNEKLVGHIDANNGLPSDSVRSIVESSSGQYYIGTSDSMAIVKFQEKEDDDTIAASAIIHKIKYADKIAADKYGNVVVISSYGTMFLLNDESIMAEENLSEKERFTACIFDNKGTLYVGTSLGNVFTYQLQNEEFQRMSVKECNGIGKVNNLITVNKDTIFVCADNGIGYFDKANVFHSLKTNSFTSSIYNVIKDYQGNLWFASSRMGLLRLCKTNFSELFTECSVAESVVNTIERFDGCLYVGTDNGLVILEEEKHKSIENMLTEEFAGIRIRQIFRDKRNHLWFCTYGNGLAEFDGYDIRYYDEENSHIGNRVRTMIELSTGELLVSSENGITFIRDGVIENTLTERDGLKNQINLCLLEKSDGTILVGSDGSGIAQIKRNKISYIGKEQGLPSDVILRMAEDEKGKGIFVVTSNALCYLEEDGSVKVLNNFPYSNNYDIIQQDDSIFILSSSGIYVLLRDELLANHENMKYTFLDSRAGLHTALVANSWVLHEKEKVYLATSSGTTLFDLKAYDEQPSSFKVRVASIVVDGEKKSLATGETFSFSKKVNRLEIRPEIINYSTVDPIISCYLEGFDKTPITMPQSELSTIVYTNLPAGKYSFHITLVDSESGVSISEKVYRLEREVDFTETIWFYVLLIGSVVLVATWVGIFVLKSLYDNRIRAKEAELEESWKISATDELTGLKNRFAMRNEAPSFIGKHIMVTMMDIDYFKRFNDNYGHEMGDTILKTVSDVILKYYSHSDTLAFRFGGDEFLLVDFNGDEEIALQRLHDMADVINQMQVEQCDDAIHVSYGYVFGLVEDESCLKKMRNEADVRLYEVKRKRSF